MMNIEAYYDKLEAAIAARKTSKSGKNSKRGLLAPSGKDTATNKDQTNQMVAIVEIIEGIREAREEILNGTK
jgi:hypothetical protein